MQNQYEGKEFVEASTSTNPEQENGYKNDLSVHNNIESNRYKTFDTVEALIQAIKADMEAFVQLIEDLIKPRNFDYIFASKNDSRRQGINQSYWTTFVRVIKRTYGDYRDCLRGGY